MARTSIPVDERTRDIVRAVKGDRTYDEFLIEQCMKDQAGEDGSVLESDNIEVDGFEVDPYVSNKP